MKYRLSFLIFFKFLNLLPYIFLFLSYQILSESKTELKKRIQYHSEFIKSSEYGEIKKVKEFLKDKNLDINFQDRRGYTAPHSSSLNGHIEIVKLLIASRANLNTSDKQLMIAAACEHLVLEENQLSQKVVEFIDSWLDYHLLGLGAPVRREPVVVLGRGELSEEDRNRVNKLVKAAGVGKSQAVPVF